jgi:hypothetical protein
LKEHLFVAGTVVPVLPRTAQRSNDTMKLTTPTACRRAMLCAIDGAKWRHRLQLLG